MERRLLDALSLATQNFATSNPVKEQSNGRCPVGMFYTTMTLFAYASKVERVYTYRRGLRRCSFYWIGQCEGLELRDE